MWLEWFFDGIGSQIVGIIISLLIGGCVGGAIGYKIGSTNKVKQKQKAGNRSQQSQIGSVTINNVSERENDNDK